MAINSLYHHTIQKLSAAGISSPRLEARILIGFAGNMNPDEVTEDAVLTHEQERKLETHVWERINGKPIDKIIGFKDFYKCRFIVNCDVLSPRPDTEILVETVQEILVHNPCQTLIDLGTGSGCILLSLLKENLELRGTGIDISAAALATGRKNCDRLKLQDRCRFICADWFDQNFCSIFTQRFDIIASNPPYIPQKDIASLSSAVKNFDPMFALDGGTDGLESYRRLAEICGDILSDNGFIVLEIGINQAQDVIKIFENRQFCHDKTIPDLAGLDRCIIFRKKDCN